MNLCGFDVETWGDKPLYGLQPWRATAREQLRCGALQAWVTSYAACLLKSDGTTVEYGRTRPDRERLRKLLVTCAEKDITLVGWNTAFDVAWLLAYGLKAEVLACKWLDAMLLLRHLEAEPTYVPLPKGRWSLKTAVARFFPEDAGYEKGVAFDVADEEGWVILHQYNRADARYTVRIAKMVIDKLSPAQLQAALIEAACIPMAAETMIEGIRMNGTLASELSQTLQETANINLITLKVAYDDIDPTILASPVKLRDLLHKRWGLPVVKLTEKGAPSTDKDALAILADTDERAGLLHRYREANNNRTKFAEGTLNSLAYNGDGVSRPAFRIYGTYTGRGTYSSKTGPKGKQEVPTGVALHQWKRDKVYRRIIEPPEDHDLLEFDFAGQEFRWMAVESDDQTMLGLCMPGEDAHAYMGGRVRNIDYRTMLVELAAATDGFKDIRQLGKVANLSLQYRTGWMRLMSVAKTQYGLTLTDAEARDIWQTYRRTYPGVPAYWKRQTRSARADGYVQTLAGRRVQISGDWDDNTWAMESTAINFPIQGIGADQKYLALKVLRDRLNDYDARFYFELHDGLFLVAPKEKSLRAAHELKEVLSDLPYREAWGINLPIQFPVDAKIGPSWGDLKEIK